MAQFDDAVSELRTIRDLIRFAMSRFNAAGLHYGHGTDNALDEAACLVLHALHLPPATPDNWLDTRVTKRERKAVCELLARRVEERVPAPYLTGEAWFMGLPFHVDPRVLIPRSPIAELIETRFEPWIDGDEVQRVLDLCTGSGCIAIGCAHALPHAEVVGADLSEEALAVARMNVDRHHLGEQVRLVQSDLFAALEGELFDVVVSNPPYVDAAEMAALPAEYRHEPALALAAGEDGLDVVVRMLRDAPEHLTNRGILIVEVGASQPALEARFPTVPFTWLEFERGGDGVFLLTAGELRKYHKKFRAAARGTPKAARKSQQARSSE